jgi:hypothetical protein
MMRVSRIHLPAWALVLVIAAVAGCGPGEEKLHRVWGVVTHNGKPIPKGNIYFDPKVDGPQGYAHIVNGNYDTAQEGQGVRGGAYDVRVNGYDGKPAHEAPFGQALFPEYAGTKDLPQEDSKFDLDIPKSR